MNHNSSAPLLRHLFILVPRTHLLLTEVAGLELYIFAYGGKMFGKEDAFSMQALVIYVVAEEEATFLVGMAVEVEEGKQLLPSVFD